MEELTRKEKGFVKDYIETGNGTQSILKNYNIKSENPENVAGVMAHRELRKDKIKNAIAEALPDELLAEKHLELLNKTDEKGGIDVPAVRAGLDMAYKIKGSYAPEKKKVEIEETESDEYLDRLAEKISKLEDEETDEGTDNSSETEDSDSMGEVPQDKE